MYLIEILLPTFGPTGERFPKENFDRVRAELTDRFGGVTAFLLSPAFGLWRDEKGELQHDDIAIFEVMAGHLDREWWQDYREQLEQRFQQQEIVVRAAPTERL